MPQTDAFAAGLGSPPLFFATKLDVLWMVGSAGLSSGAGWCGARLQPVHPWTNTWLLLKATGIWGCLLLQEHLFFMNDTSFFFNIQVTAFPTLPPCSVLWGQISDLH